MASTCSRTWAVACAAARAVVLLLAFLFASALRAEISQALHAEISQEEILRRLERLERAQQKSLDKLRERDRRIEQLEQQLRLYRRDDLSEQVVRPGGAPAAQTVPAQTAAARKPERFGRVTPGRGALLANTDLGSVSFSPYTYLRYLNQHDLDENYTAAGTLAKGLQYRAMLGNNLSQLGASASQLDDRIDTFAGAIWWMPTTGEYGPNQGFGDFEQHDRLATRVGFHYSHSTQDEQSQPDAEAPATSTTWRWAPTGSRNAACASSA